MNIGKISTFNYYRPVTRSSSLYFKAGYEDLKKNEDKIIFDRTIEFSASLYSLPHLYKEKTVKLNGEKMTLVTFDNGFYILKGADDDIKATMSTTERKCETEDCDNDFYSKNKGAIEISLLFSKGKGAGKFLIKEAVKRSFEKGYDGRVVLFAATINESIGSPIPFYYKMGFKAYNKNIQKYIEKQIKNYGQDASFDQHQETLMYLNPKKIKEYLD